MTALTFPLTPPESGTPVAVAPGVWWLRLALPYALDHVNVWLLADGDGWTLVDTGVADDPTRDAWRRVLDGPVIGGRPVRRLVVTHFHPDHFGLAGWLVAETGAGMWMSRADYLTARMHWLDSGAEAHHAQADLFARHGLNAERVAALKARGNPYRDRLSPPPSGHRRLADHASLTLDGHPWRVIEGHGHCPEHAALYRPAGRILIAGDMVLPTISPVIASWAWEPDADPLGAYLASLDRLAGLPADTLVLPSHGAVFRGLRPRCRQLRAHHEDRLARILAAANDGPVTAAGLLPVLFRRELDTHQLLFAMGEAIAHLVWLEQRGRLVRNLRDGVAYFCRAD